MADIKVKLKATGQTGTIDSSEFDPALFEKQFSGIPKIIENLPGTMGGAGLIPTPFSPLAGALGQTAGYVIRDVARPMYGEQTGTIPQVFNELPGEMAKGAAKGFAGWQIPALLTGLSRLPEKLPFGIGKNIQQNKLTNTGQKIQDLTAEEVPGVYPTKDLTSQIKEQTKKWQKLPALNKVINQEVKGLSKEDQGGNVPLFDIQARKELAGSGAYDKTAPLNQRGLLKQLADIYQKTTLNVEPALEKPLAEYSRLKQQLNPEYNQTLNYLKNRVIAGAGAMGAGAILAKLFGLFK